MTRPDCAGRCPRRPLARRVGPPAIFFLLAFGCAPLSGPGGPAVPADFSGRWVLNHGVSDDPAEQLRTTLPGGGGPRGGWSGTGGGPPVDEPGESPEPGEPGATPDDSARPREPRGLAGGRLGARLRALSDLLAPAESLRVEQEGLYLLVHDGGRRTLELHLRPTAPRDTSLVGDRPWPARWSGVELTHERDAPGGAAIIQSYRLEDSGRRLVVRTRFHPADDMLPRLTLQSVYDRRPAS